MNRLTMMLKKALKRAAEKEEHPKSAGELWIMAMHNYMMTELPHAYFLRKAPKNYRWVRANEKTRQRD